MWFEAHCKLVSMKWVVLEVHWYQFPKAHSWLGFFWFVEKLQMLLLIRERT
jgi:hypothetical protein